jgi:hypothetical protein
MDTIIADPAGCEVRAVIRFLHTEGQSVAEIQRRLCRVYGANIMSDSSEVDPTQTAQCSLKASFSCTTKRGPTPRLAQKL